MRAVAVIPARSGSERLPRKNLATLEGRSLVRRALETALAAGFDCVALSSDSDEILAEAEGLQVACVRRPVVLVSRPRGRSMSSFTHSPSSSGGRALRRRRGRPGDLTVHSIRGSRRSTRVARAERSGLGGLGRAARGRAPPAETEAARCGWTAHGLSRRRRADPLHGCRRSGRETARCTSPAARCSTAGR